MQRRIFPDFLRTRLRIGLYFISLAVGDASLCRSGEEVPLSPQIYWDQANLDQQAAEVAGRAVPATMPGDAPVVGSGTRRDALWRHLDRSDTVEVVFGDMVGGTITAPHDSAQTARPEPVLPATEPAPLPRPLIELGVAVDPSAAAPVQSVPAPAASPSEPSAATEESVAGVDAPALTPAEADVDRDAISVDELQQNAAPPIEPAVEPKPVVTQPPAARSMPNYVSSLRRPLEQCLQQHAQIRLNSGDDSCWSIMHSFLGWGPTTEIHVTGPKGRRVNAINWLAQNQACGGRRLFYLDNDRLRGREGPGYQGHPAQFLAMLAQCNIDTTLPLRVSGRSFTVQDLIVEEQRTCFAETELTFKLIGLSHYLGSTANWQNDRNESWNAERLLAVELAQPVNGAACGGTHRLMSISYALNKRGEEGGPVEGTWLRARKYIEDYHRYTLTLQNQDGSFSSDWFKRRADWGDMDRRVQTTGHILEWLVFSLPEESLYDPRIARAVSYLTQSMVQHRYYEWEVGPKGHAVRALRLYHQRVFERSQHAAAPLARRPHRQANGR